VACPLRSHSYRWRGFAYMGLDQYEVAVRDFDEAIRIDPTDSLGYLFRSLTHHTLGHAQKAYEDFNKAIFLMVAMSL